MPTPLILLLVFLPAFGPHSHSQQMEVARAEDERMVLAVDSLTRIPAYVSAPDQANCSGNGAAAADHTCLVVWMTLMHVKTGKVGVPSRPPFHLSADWNLTLTDSDGVVHDQQIVGGDYAQAMLPEGVSYELPEGASLTAVFAVLKKATPTVLRWIYAYWDVTEGRQVSSAEIKVRFPPADSDGS